MKRPRPIFRTGILRGRVFRIFGLGLGLGRGGVRMPLDLVGPYGSGYRRRRGLGRLPLVLSVLLVVVAAGGLVLWSRAPASRTVTQAAVASVPVVLAANAPVVERADLGRLAAPAGRAIVVDGDTLRLQDAVVRLDGVEAPARGVACNHAARSDCAAASAAELAGLVADHAVSCQVVGHDRLGRPTGRCDAGMQAGVQAGMRAGQVGGPANAGSLNEQIVASGWARARAVDLQPAETAARAAGRGLWAAAVRTDPR